MTKPFVTFQTFAYNSEQYIAQTIESVLNQSEENIEYFIRDNGSTDRTGEICRAYAEKDRRITLLQNKVNYLSADGEPLWIGNMFPQANGEYVAFIDSDDYLDPDFVRCTYFLAVQNNADIVIGGTTMFNDNHPENKSIRIPPSIIISDDYNLTNDDFINMYGSIRPIWGKLYKTEFFLEHIQYACSWPRDLCYGTDTYISISYMLKAKKIVCIDKALHNYRVRSNSYYHSAKPDFSRIKDGEVLFNKALEYLKLIHLENETSISFLANVYFFHVKDVIELLINFDGMTCSEKIEFIEELMNNSFFCGCTFNDSVFRYLIDVIEIIYKYASSKEELELIRFYTVRLYKSRRELRYEYVSNPVALYLSALCDKNNKYLWGFSLLNIYLDKDTHFFKVINELSTKHKELLFTNPVLVRNLVNSQLEGSNTSDLKNEILDLINEKNFTEAINLIDTILINRPLDNEALYLKIYSSYETGNVEAALIYGNIAKVFWSEDEDICKIVKYIEDRI